MDPKTEEGRTAQLHQSKRALDILYTIEWADADGNKVKTFKSDKPFDNLQVASNVEEASDAGEKPILEIVIPITGSVASSQGSPGNLNPGDTATSRSTRISRDLPDNVKDIAISTIDAKKMIIRSEFLLEELRNIVSYYPGQALTGDDVTIIEPYPVLMHHIAPLSELHQRLKKEVTEQTVEKLVETKCHHLGVLMEFLEPKIQQKLKPAQARLQQFSPVTTFDGLWHLYRPGEDVYFKNSHLDRYVGGVVLESFLSSAPPNDYNAYNPGARRDLWHLTLFHLSFDGRKLTRFCYYFGIANFKGEKKIRTLPVYPTKYWDNTDGGQRRRELESHGKKYFEIARAGSKL
ncbi:MAG: hypothetical protein M1820_010852, partial [Bogoriella megaspora]